MIDSEDVNKSSTTCLGVLAEVCVYRRKKNTQLGLQASAFTQEALCLYFSYFLICAIWGNAAHILLLKTNKIWQTCWKHFPGAYCSQYNGHGLLRLKANTDSFINNDLFCTVLICSFP